MRVLLTKPFFNSDIDYIKQRIHSEIEIVIPEVFTEDMIAELASDIDVLFGGLITEKVLQNSPRLKFIQIPWTGIENINFDLITKYQVIVCNSHSNSRIVAEYAIALMFDATKKIAYHDKLMRSGNWNRPGLNINSIDPFSGVVTGSRIGIIGFGAIGRNIYKMLSGFECEFKVFDKYLDENSIVGSDIVYYPIDRLHSELGDINCIFLCLPLTNETKDIVNYKFLSSLNKNCIIVNTSRGEIINEKDLYEALADDKICFAAIDTWYNYPSKQNPIVFPSLNNDFHKLENIVLSPHRAGFVKDGFPHLDDAIENLNRFYKGEELINIVSAQKRY